MDYKMDVPPLIVSTAQLVVSKGLDLEGIFRISPDVRMMQETKKKLEKPGTFLADITTDAYVAAHLMKDYLRKSKDPLFPMELNKSFIDAAKVSDFNEKIHKYRQCITTLPTPSRRILIIIAYVARLVVDHTNENKMSFQALGVVLGPCFMHLSSLEMIEMWDSRVAEEILGNFGAIDNDNSTEHTMVLSNLMGDPQFTFTVGPPLTAKVSFIGGGGGGGGGAVDLQVNIGFIGKDDPCKMELFCACGLRRAVDSSFAREMSKKAGKPLQDVAILDSGNTVGVQLNYVFDWLDRPALPPPPSPAALPPPPLGLTAPSSTTPRPSTPSFDAAVKDARGVQRGGCKNCSCHQYRLPLPVGDSESCVYCEHTKGKHTKEKCAQCECNHYEQPVAPTHHRCASCTHPPTDHSIVSSPPELPPLPPPPTFLPPTTPPPTTLPVSKTPPPPHQDYKAILSQCNVLVLTFSILNRTALQTIKTRWIPALLELGVTAPILLVGTNREKRDENAPDLSEVSDAQQVVDTHPSIYGYTEVSVAQYKGFRTLANMGLAAVLFDLQAKKAKISKSRGSSMLASSLASSGSIEIGESGESGSGGSGKKSSSSSKIIREKRDPKDPNKECRVM